MKNKIKTNVLLSIILVFFFSCTKDDNKIINNTDTEILKSNIDLSISPSPIRTLSPKVTPTPTSNSTATPTPSLKPAFSSIPIDTYTAIQKPTSTPTPTPSLSSVPIDTSKLTTPTSNSTATPKPSVTPTQTSTATPKLTEQEQKTKIYDAFLKRKGEILLTINDSFYRANKAEHDEIRIQTWKQKLYDDYKFGKINALQYSQGFQDLYITDYIYYENYKTLETDPQEKNLISIKLSNIYNEFSDYYKVEHFLPI